MRDSGNFKIYTCLFFFWSSYWHFKELCLLLFCVTLGEVTLFWFQTMEIGNHVHIMHFPLYKLIILKSCIIWEYCSYLLFHSMIWHVIFLFLLKIHLKLQDQAWLIIFFQCLGIFYQFYCMVSNVASFQ